MKKYYFSSDFHLGHVRVLREDYDNRPFESIEKHDASIIANHNSIVKPTDDFYFLGDFAFAKKEKTEAYLQQLMGNKFFIKGNHDHKDTIKLYERYGIYLGEQKRITIDKQDIILNHFAMRTWNRSHHGSFHLYGHSHGKLEANLWGKSMDVCIILNNYFPFEFEQIRKLLNDRDAKLLGDHHK